MVDVDDTVREVHGYAKQGAAFGYTRQRGLNIQLATLSTPLAAPVIARARLRRGNTASATGSGRLLAQALSTARAAGVWGQVMCRADSAYYGWAFVGTALRHKAWFSVTARMTKAVTAAIAAIPAQAWQPITYPNAVYDEAEQRWVSDAEVAEIESTAFTSRRMQEHVPCRLVVRRVKRRQPLATDGTQQGELFAAYRHHAFITNSTFSTVEADERHRDHALVEQVIAELKDGPLAHLQSGGHRQRCLGRPGGHRVQPGPRQRRRRRAAHLSVGDAAPHDHRHPRTPGHDLPPHRPTPARQLALGSQLAVAVVHRDRPTPRHHRLTTQPTRARPEDPRHGRAGASRQTTHPRTTNQNHQTAETGPHHSSRWIRAQAHRARSM